MAKARGARAGCTSGRSLFSGGGGLLSPAFGKSDLAGKATDPGPRRPRWKGHPPLRGAELHLGMRCHHDRWKEPESMPCPNPTEGEQNPTGNHVVKHNGNHVVKHNGNHVVKHDGNHVVKHDGNHVVRQNNASASRTSPGDHWACFGCRSPHAISALTSISFSSFHHLKLSKEPACREKDADLRNLLILKDRVVPSPDTIATEPAGFPGGHQRGPGGSLNKAWQRFPLHRSPMRLRRGGEEGVWRFSG